MSTRINRYLAETGHGSRREADRLVDAGEVTINGRRAVPGDMVEEGDDVQVGGRSAGARNEKVYLAFYKPVGVITTTDRTSPDNIMEALEAAPGDLPNVRVFPVGRLDVASSGLILLTNDSELSTALLRPEGGHEKSYDVDVDKPVEDEALRIMRAGVDVLGRPTLPAKVTRTGPTSFTIAIVEGRNRQIRRMCEAVGLEVVRLRRTRIANIELGTLKKGTWRHLTPTEIRELKRRVLKR